MTVVELNPAPPDFGVVLDVYLERQREFRDAQRTARLGEKAATPGWYASSLGGCYRAQYMDRLGIPRKREIDSSTRRTFAWGDHIEDFVRQAYQRSGLVLDAQTKLEVGSLSGRLDLLLQFPPAEVSSIPADVRSKWSPEWIAFLETLRSDPQFRTFEGSAVTEVKSAKSSAMGYFAKARKKGTNRGRDNHHIQVGSYIAMAAQMPDGPKPDFWQIEYVGKDGVGVFRFKVTDEDAENALARWKNLDEIWAAQPDPSEVECECQGWMIQYCNFANDDGTCCGHTWETAAPAPEAQGLFAEGGR